LSGFKTIEISYLEVVSTLLPKRKQYSRRKGPKKTASKHMSVCSRDMGIPI
jgi:hypothetical protein